jgi:hypothetical protein
MLWGSAPGQRTAWALIACYGVLAKCLGAPDQLRPPGVVGHKSTVQLRVADRTVPVPLRALSALMLQFPVAEVAQSLQQTLKALHQAPGRAEPSGSGDRPARRCTQLGPRRSQRIPDTLAT